MAVSVIARVIQSNRVRHPMKRDHAKQVERPTAIGQMDDIRELTLADLEIAVGGKGAQTSGVLFRACCTGKHIPKASITL
jgi:hypothetical protein